MLLIMFSLSVCSMDLLAQDQGYIYGKVTTIDGKSYEGSLRWGKEEVFWSDHFNAKKQKNNNLDYLSRDDKNRFKEYYEATRKFYNRGFFVFGTRYDNDYTHIFVCQFGEIKSIKPSGRHEVKITLQSGINFEVDDSSNDIGTKVRVLNEEIGELALEWSRIENIEFMSTPSKLDKKFGEPLYGTVETYGGTFTGFIQWDHDERVDTDKLDGDTEDGDVSIAFDKIKSIERSGSSKSIVTLNSGREMELRGSNDVNSRNKGIVVTSEKFGRVDIPWDEFRKVSFEKSTGQLKSYANFKFQKELSGIVKTKRGESLEGRIIFDLDENYNYEVLQGEGSDIEYSIPFRLINKVAPKGHNNSSVTLKNDITLVLEDKQDVSERNTGILVFKDADNPTYITWDSIDEITFF